MILDKLQGKAITHFEEVDLWRILKAECVHCNLDQFGSKPISDSMINATSLILFFQIKPVSKEDKIKWRRPKLIFSTTLPTNVQ